jgi:hypothetical protein
MAILIKMKNILIAIVINAKKFAKNVIKDIILTNTTNVKNSLIIAKMRTKKGNALNVKKDTI